MLFDVDIRRVVRNDRTSLYVPGSHLTKCEASNLSGLRRVSRSLLQLVVSIHAYTILCIHIVSVFSDILAITRAVFVMILRSS